MRVLVGRATREKRNVLAVRFSILMAQSDLKKRTYSVSGCLRGLLPPELCSWCALQVGSVWPPPPPAPLGIDINTQFKRSPEPRLMNLIIRPGPVCAASGNMEVEDAFCRSTDGKK